MNLRFSQATQELLRGAIDIHIHSAPDVYPRIQNDLELAAQAREAGMRAIVIKNHFFETASRAALARMTTAFQVFGGIALNWSMGGLNPAAVEPALKMGAKMVWLPTVHARDFMGKKDQVPGLAAEIKPGQEGLYCLTSEGKLKTELQEIFALIKQYDAALATGHISKAEARQVVPAAAAAGVAKIVITHPQASFVAYTPAEMKELLDLGATWLEHCFNDTTRMVDHPLTREALFQGIREAGVERAIMSTDSGQWLNPVPAQQMGICLTDMLNFGFTPREIKTMVHENPADLLGLVREEVGYA